MTIESDLAERLVDGQRSGASAVDQDAYSTIDRAAAYRVQAAVMSALGKSPAMFKAAVSPIGDGAIAPIYAGRVGDSGVLKLPSAGVVGLEVEIGLVLGRDLAPGSDRAAVEAAVGRFFMGVEICGSRYADRKRAAFDTGLADSMSAFGYVTDPRDWERGTDLDGLDLELEFGGETIFAGAPKQGFGGVLEALVACARLAGHPYPLTAGTVVTTGSLCGLVPTSGPGKAVARMGGHILEVELI